MLLRNYKDIVSVSFKDSSLECEEYYGDIALELKNHLSYVNHVDDLELELINGYCIKECDYCGGKINRIHRSGTDGHVMTQKYIDRDSEYPCTDDCCRDCHGLKTKIVFWEKHGVMKNINAIKTMEKNGKIPTSRQQIYLNNLLKGEINNFFHDIGFIDIVLENEKLIIEYDGGGHYLGTQFGTYTYEEKLQSDFERDLKLRSLGYRVIRIHSESDYLPSDEIIITQIGKIKEHFQISEKEFFKWIIPKRKKDKTYGELRIISEKDLNRE